MASRPSTGKRLRFTVFQRDHFTCQYCGAQPPDVVLVCDHITPVAKGGATTLDNLITACEPCNQGKADRELGHVAPRPDADLLYLATQQEIAELRRYQAALREKEAAIAQAIHDLQELWCNSSGLDWHPSDSLMRKLLYRYPIEVVGNAILDVALKVAGGYIKSYGDHWVKYLFSVARNIAAAIARALPPPKHLPVLNWNTYQASDAQKQKFTATANEIPFPATALDESVFLLTPRVVET